MQKEYKNTSLAILPVVLAGGSGSRLWPLSRTNYPKQFLSLVDDLSLFQNSVLRFDFLKNQSNLKSTLIVSNETHRFLVLDQLHAISKEADIILESVAKNTAPSLTLAALHATEKYDDAVLIVTPADHDIGNIEEFQNALDIAINNVNHSDDKIVTLGIKPTRPETGYGYIKTNNLVPDAINSNSNDGCLQVEKFVEKPDLKKASEYLQRDDYFWNSGIFVLKATTWLKAMAAYSKDMLLNVQKSWRKKQFDIPFIRPCALSFKESSANSIDYAVMEHLPSPIADLSMVKLLSEWSDLGSWESVSEKKPVDEYGNAFVGDVISVDSKDCFVHASERLISLVGVSDLVVVETADSVLVTHKSNSQEVKKVVSELNNKDRNEAVLHRKVHRPWGWYDSIDEDKRFKVKRICVKPKACLSLQKHHHRAEHWVVVKGTAEVTCGEKITLYTENQSTYIPLGEVHRLMNPGTIPLEIIEVQSGSYLGEDDIIRLDDVYGRSEQFTP